MRRLKKEGFPTRKEKGQNLVITLGRIRSVGPRPFLFLSSNVTVNGIGKGVELCLVLLLFRDEGCRRTLPFSIRRTGYGVTKTLEGFPEGDRPNKTPWIPWTVWDRRNPGYSCLYHQTRSYVDLLRQGGCSSHIPLVHFLVSRVEERDTQYPSQPFP